MLKHKDLCSVYLCLGFMLLIHILIFFTLYMTLTKNRQTNGLFDIPVKVRASMENGSYFLMDILAIRDFLDDFNGVTNQSVENIIDITNATKIGILIPSTTRKLRHESLTKFSLLKDCIPSVLKTITKGYFYKIFIGIDEDDRYLTKLQENVQRQSANVSISSVELVKVKSNNFVTTVNALARTALDQGMDYLLRINDDTVFTSKNWTQMAIQALKTFDPSNIGVAGPSCEEGKTLILTHDFVHRTHFEIFQFYYPPQFENWWADDWITAVYQPNRVSKLPGWTVKHLLQETRYSVNKNLQSFLANMVARDNEKMIAYVSSLRKDSCSSSKLINNR